MEYSLRYYQKEAIEAYFGSSRRGGLIRLPTGAGKSVVVKEIASYYNNPLIVTPRVELVRQYEEKYKIKSICRNSLPKHNNRINEYDLIVFDEAHFFDTELLWFDTDFLEKYKGDYTGLTATPIRAGSVLLHNEKLFYEEIYAVEIFELVENGYLAPVVFEEVPKISSFDLYLTIETLIKIKEKFEDEPVLVFLPKIKDVGEVSKKLEELGYSCLEIHSNNNNRAKDIFKYDFCLNVKKLREGFDYPPLRCIVMLANLGDISTFLQVCGRGMRIHEGKDACHIYDYSSNYLLYQHLFSREKLEKYLRYQDNQKTKKCACGKKANTSTNYKCRQCGEVYPKYKRKIERNEAVEYEGALFVAPETVKIFEKDVESGKCLRHDRTYIKKGQLRFCENCFFISKDTELIQDFKIKIKELNVSFFEMNGALLRIYHFDLKKNSKASLYFYKDGGKRRIQENSSAIVQRFPNLIKKAVNMGDYLMKDNVNIKALLIRNIVHEYMIHF